MLVIGAPAAHEFSAIRTSDDALPDQVLGPSSYEVSNSLYGFSAAMVTASSAWVATEPNSAVMFCAKEPDAGK